MLFCWLVYSRKGILTPTDKWMLLLSGAQIPIAPGMQVIGTIVLDSVKQQVQARIEKVQDGNAMICLSRDLIKQTGLWIRVDKPIPILTDRCTMYLCFEELLLRYKQITNAEVRGCIWTDGGWEVNTNSLYLSSVYKLNDEGPQIDLASALRALPPRK